jgi:hypothetical protein
MPENLTNLTSQGRRSRNQKMEKSIHHRDAEYLGVRRCFQNKDSLLGVLRASAVNIRNLVDCAPEICAGCENFQLW